MTHSWNMWTHGKKHGLWNHFDFEPMKFIVVKVKDITTIYQNIKVSQYHFVQIITKFLKKFQISKSIVNYTILYTIHCIIIII